MLKAREVPVLCMLTDIPKFFFKFFFQNCSRANTGGVSQPSERAQLAPGRIVLVHCLWSDSLKNLPAASYTRPFSRLADPHSPICTPGYKTQVSAAPVPLKGAWVPHQRPWGRGWAVRVSGGTELLTASENNENNSRPTVCFVQLQVFKMSSSSSV